ncbi:hypothetical protein [Helicobacter sp. T3_23-1056]
MAIYPLVITTNIPSLRANATAFAWQSKTKNATENIDCHDFATQNLAMTPTPTQWVARR